MTPHISLKETERKAFRDSQQDGLMEIVIGICLVAMSARLLSRPLIFTLAFPLFLPRILLPALRKRFTYRRIGYVKLIPDEAKKIVPGIFLILLILIAVMAVALLLFGDVSDFDLWVKWCPALFGTQLAGLFLSLASKTGSVRHCVFAVWSVVSGFVSSILNFEFRTAGVFIYFLMMGGLLALWGLVLFIRFLRKFPTPAEEVMAYAKD
ncbi:hypothetical protein HQ563_03230 [bacterium]|nr:hypothetical protein [bacterium]